MHALDAYNRRLQAEKWIEKRKGRVLGIEILSNCIHAMQYMFMKPLELSRF